MSKVTVHRNEDGNTGNDGNTGKAEQAQEAVRRRAYELFGKRGGAPGGEPGDWLRAENELLLVPHAVVKETSKGFKVSMPVPGFDAGDIEAMAWRRVLLVGAWREKETAKAESRVLYRRFELASPITTKKVTARIDEGTLTIEAPKETEPVAARAAAA